MAKELDGLLLHQAGVVAQKRLARGLKLNHPEAVALLSSQVPRCIIALWSAIVPLQSCGIN